MSELPEIESVVYFLKPHLVNRKIKKVILEKESILVNSSKEELISNLTNRTITDFSRRGKILSFLFNDESRLYIHPRMVGQLITCPNELHKIKHTHLIMKLDNNEEFRYIDVRRLGKLYYIKINESVGYDEYLKGEGRDFENMHTLRLYDSDVCPACGNELTRMKIATRGTVYCSKCQK